MNNLWNHEPFRHWPGNLGLFVINVQGESGGNVSTSGGDNIGNLGENRSTRACD